MQKTAVALLFIYLLSYAEVYQLFYVPSLIHHYQEHRLANREITFIDFFRMHYAQEQHRHDGNQHERLPFNDHHAATLIHQFSIPEVAMPTFFAPFEADQHETFYQSPLTNLSCLSSIWQPPRNVVA